MDSIEAVNCQNLIGGQWVPAESGSTSENRCPADTDQFLGTAPDSASVDVEQAVAAAKAAQGPWAATPAPTRGDIILEVTRVLRRRGDELARALSLEEGKILPEAKGEVQKTLKYLEFAAGDARRITGITAESELPGTFAFTMWRPHGVVGLITPWNFPVCIPLWKIAPALITGNAVVLKPAPETPLTAHIIGEILAEAGVPDGVVNIVYGDVEPAQALLKHPDVHAISFTGSTEVGRIIERTCGELHKPVQCELGGKNPIIVMDDADLELAAAATAKGAFGSTGQRCTATSRAIVHNAVADEFVARVVEAAQAVQAGHPLHPDTTMGPSVSERQMEQVLRYHAIAESDGAKRLIGGGRLTDGDLARGYFPAPSVYDHAAADSRIATEEIFGPFLTVIRVDTLDEAIQAANAVDFGLTSAVFTQSLSNAFACVQGLDTGMTQVNAPTIGGEGHLPFGGIKATGVGPREMGPDAWKFYAELKTVYINHASAKRTSNFY
ncbi:MAG: aldehyde dehydrogenase family protein [Myxococcota bacterium]|nr:aldehyde dehydrogenase family protein [Myxococcota bacterium]